MAKNPSTFIFVNNINQDKELLDFEANRSQYQPFVINRSLSGNIDTVMFADEMNSRPHLDKDMQYAYLFHSIKKRNRHSQWLYKSNNELMEALRLIYGFDYRKAKEAMNILRPEELEVIRQAYLVTEGT